jgi:nucleotide-binding universal stress UspA family protein
MAILVPYDGSRPAQQAAEYAVSNWNDEEIVLLRVIEAADGSLEAGIDLIKERLKEQRQEGPAELSAEVKATLTDSEAEFRVETTVGNPAREIVDFAEANEISHIVIGSHGRTGASRVLLGSVAQTVVRRAPTPVTVVR